jgi:site-specific DNA-cytosine methylase
MLIFDFFAGTGSATKAFEDAGHRVIKIELDEYFEADERNILLLTRDYLLAKYGRPDFIWASPPCQTFSVASCSKYWTPDGLPKNDKALAGLDLVKHTLNLIESLSPVDGFIIENPRGMLRKQSIMAELPRRTVTYCQYGDIRMKPTDLFGYARAWQPRKPCKNGDSCHVSAPRGSRTGTQGIKGAKARSVIPYELSLEICNYLYSITETRPAYA